MEYSGRTTCYEHVRDNWEDYPKNHGVECIQDVKYLDVQWSNCPVEIAEEVKKIWCQYELGNDFYIFKWEWEEKPEEYPIIAEFLRSKGLTEKDRVIIHWWW